MKTILTLAAQDAVGMRLFEFQQGNLCQMWASVRAVYNYLPIEDKRRYRKLARLILTEALPLIKRKR
jgi:hypothetical protein